MITLFDLREKPENTIIEDIRNLYKEPLKVVRLYDGSIKA